MDSDSDRGQQRDARQRRRHADTYRPLKRLGAAFGCALCFYAPAAAETLPPLDLETSAHETMEESLPRAETPAVRSKRAEEKVPPAEGKSPGNTVSLHVKDAPAKDLIQGLAELTGRNVVLAGKIDDRVTAALTGVTPEEALRAVLASAGLVAREDGSTLVIFGHQDDSHTGKGFTSYRLSYASAEDVAEGLEDLLTGGKVSYNAAANTVMVAGTPQELMEARRLLRELDVPEKQVKVEAEILAVDKTYAKDLGIDWDFKSLTGSATYTRDNWSEEKYVTDENGDLKYDSDGDPRVRYIEHSGWRADIPEGYAGISYGRSVTGHPYTFFFQAKLNALVSKGKARVLAKPNVVTLNGREAEILIGSKIPVVVEHMENGVKTTATEYKDAGIKLTYTPVVSPDDDITADVHAEVSTPYLVPEMKAYRIVTRSASTMVRLPSGGVMTIGGLIDKEEARTFRKVPILGDIPLIGKLFQSTSRTQQESEIVILIRAEVLK